MTKESEFDCIVVGAGVVGSALSHTLARDGRKVLLIERDMSEPDRIVGELLQPGGLKVLQKLGLGGCVKDIDSIPNYGYVVINGRKSVHLKYPNFDEGGDSKANMNGTSFHYGRFVMKLREACRAQKESITILEATVNDLVTTDDDESVIGVKCSKKDENGVTQVLEFCAPLTFVVDGCFSKFRKEISHRDVAVSSHFVGAILHNCPLPRPNHGHVVLAQPSPVLLYQIGTNETRVLVDVPGKVPSAGNGDLKNYMLNHVMPQLPEAVQPSFKDAIDSQRLRTMPSSYLPSILNNRKGLWVLGDALNMRHPLTGGGMTVGLSDVALLSELLHPSVISSFQSRKLVMLQMEKFQTERKRHATVINVLANALYALFSGDDWKMKSLRDACFAYFEVGGICADHPVGLLAGLIRSPMTLYLHFFAVAFYGMFRMLLSPCSALSSLALPISEKDSFAPVLNAILFVPAVILSLPVNLVSSLLVLISAASVISPLIAKEVFL